MYGHCVLPPPTITTTLLDLAQGDFFGELALLTKEERNATVIARVYCDVLVLHKKDFNSVMQASRNLYSETPNP